MKKTYLNTLTNEEIIKRLKDGEVVKCTNRSDNFIKMIDGVIILKDDNILYNWDFIVDATNDYYFEEKKPFIITETGVYKTRSGEKAYVYNIKNKLTNMYPIQYTRNNIELSVTVNGRYTTEKESIHDIVSKWED